MLNVEYSLTAPDQMILELENHLVGAIFIEAGTQIPPSKTFVRRFVSLHPMFVSLNTDDPEVAIQWLDAGASKVFAPVENEYLNDRILSLSEKPVAIPADQLTHETVVNHIFNLAKFDEQTGLIPTVVCDRTGIALGLVYSNKDSILQAVKSGQGTYWSRSRQEIWVKGQTSGATQKLLRIDLDCDCDTLRFIVEQNVPGFCHKKSWTCFSEIENDLNSIERHLLQKIRDCEPDSYTSKLVNDRKLLQAKIREEADETIKAKMAEEVICETSDLFYFAMTHAIANGVSLNDISAELGRRRFHVTRRGGAAKPHFESKPETTG